MTSSAALQKMRFVATSSMNTEQGWAMWRISATAARSQCSLPSLKIWKLVFLLLKSNTKPQLDPY